MTGRDDSEHLDLVARGICPILRGLLAEPSGDADIPFLRAVLRTDTSQDARDFLRSGNLTDLAGAPVDVTSPELPPLVLSEIEYDAAPEVTREHCSAAIAAYQRANACKPEVILMPELGIARVVEMPMAAEKPLHNEVALVTGAAGAIGAGICRGLLEQGCRVAATDLAGERLDSLVEGFRETFGDRAIGVELDVTDPEGVRAGFARVTREWGGVDVAIPNAGIPMIASLVEMELSGFRNLERVNVEGTMLTLAEAGRVMQLQGTGGDIVLVSTKNVFSPGARFGAYSATKAACHQLARIASLEMAPFGIRVNMVAPDAVFGAEDRKSGLWVAIGPDRMRHRGIDEKGLQDYYKDRNLLRARVTARHVANAVLFFVTRQTPTTGATIPVDGGLPDATPR
jgi:NAD(P)-dependent dehydrogenase (short-subunit alcohol dehydrogenase family)